MTGWWFAPAMANNDNSGPAFPITACNAVYGRGMNLRDWFAGKALAATIQKWEGSTPDNFPEIVAGISYAFADAMIAAREK